jgi:hypothetical protein
MIGLLSISQLDVLGAATRCIRERSISFPDQKPARSLALAILGGAGTGKSFVSKSMCDTFLRLIPGSVVLVAAPTGVAAFNVQGQTLHSLLKLSVDRDGKRQSMSELSTADLLFLRQIFRVCSLLLIDEISMVSSEVLAEINERLHTILNNHYLFGGLNVIVVGDFAQLPPVFGTSAFKGALWSRFTEFILRQNMRQKDDQVYLQCLDRLRFGKPNETDEAYLRSRVCEAAMIPGAQLSSQFAEFDHVMRVFPLREQVKAFNGARMRQIGGTIFRIKAVDQNSEKQGNATVEPTREEAGLQPCVSVCLNMKVQLRRNIRGAIDVGLHNGAIGRIVHVQWSALDCVTIDRVVAEEQHRAARGHRLLIDVIVPHGVFPEFVTIVFDDERIGKIKQPDAEHDRISVHNPELSLRQHSLYDRGVKFWPETTPFIERSKQSIHCGSRMTRTQLPFDTCYAVTAHRTQSLTLQHIVGYLGNKVFAPEIAYVICSRVTSIRGLCLSALAMNAFIVDNDVVNFYTNADLRVAKRSPFVE